MKNINQDPEIVYHESSSVALPGDEVSPPPDASEDARDDDDSFRPTDRQVGGAAVAGGLTGLIVGGPLLGVMTGAGAAVATTSKSRAGNVARRSGDAVASWGDRLLRMSKQVDEKHHVVDKTKKATRGVMTKAKQVDEKHHVVEKTKHAAGTVVDKAQRFDEKHHVTRKASQSITAGANYVSRKLNPRNDQDHSSTTA